jgi:hypothetical protein
MEEIFSFEFVGVFTLVRIELNWPARFLGTLKASKYLRRWRVMDQVHDYVKVAFDLIDDLDRLTEVEKVMSRVSTTLAEFGYTSFLITGVPEPPQRLEPYILLNGWPKG